MQIVLTISLYVISRARFSWELESTVVDHRLDYPTVMPRILDPEKYPWVLAAVAAGAFDDDDEDDDPAAWHEQDFRFGLERLLDGIDVLIGRSEEKR